MYPYKRYNCDCPRCELTALNRLAKWGGVTMMCIAIMALTVSFVVTF